MKTLIKKILLLIILIHITKQSNFNAIRFSEVTKIKQNESRDIYFFRVYNPDFSKSDEIIDPENEKIQKKNQYDTYLKEDGSPNYQKMYVSAECEFPINFDNLSKNFLFNFYYMANSSHITKTEQGQIEKKDDNYFIYANPNSGRNNYKECIPYIYEDKENDLIIIDFLLIKKDQRYLDLDIFYVDTFIKDNKLNFCTFPYIKKLRKNFASDKEKHCLIQNYQLSDDENYPAFLDLKVFENNYRENYTFQSYYNEGIMENMIKFIGLPKNRLNSHSFLFDINEFNFVSTVIYFNQDKEVTRSIFNIYSNYENEKISIIIKNNDLNTKSKCQFEGNNNEEVNEFLKNSENTDINFLFLSDNENAEKLKFNLNQEEFPNLNTKKYNKFFLSSFVSLQNFENDEVKCIIKTNLENLKNQTEDKLILNIHIKIRKIIEEGNSLLKMTFLEDNIISIIDNREFFEKKEISCQIKNIDQYLLLDKEKHMISFLYKNLNTKTGNNLNDLINQFDGKFSLKLKLQKLKYLGCTIFIKIESPTLVIFDFNLEAEETLGYSFKLLNKKNTNIFVFSNLLENLEIPCKTSENINNNFLDQNKFSLKTNFQNLKSIENITYWMKKNENELYLNIGSDEEMKFLLNFTSNKGCYIFFENDQLNLNIFDNDINNVQFKIFKNLNNQDENLNIYKLEVFNNNILEYENDNIELQKDDDFDKIILDKPINLFLNEKNNNKEYLSFSLIKIDENIYLYNLINSNFKQSKSQYDSNILMIKNYFEDKNYFSSSLLHETDFQLSFFKDFQNFDDQIYNLYILEKIKKISSYKYFLTSIKDKKIESSFIKKIPRSSDKLLYLYSKKIENAQFNNIEEQPNNKKILSIIRKKEENPLKINFSNLKILEQSIFTIYPNNLDTIRTLFICFYCEQSNLKMLSREINTEEEILLNYQNYTSNNYFMRDKKDLNLEESLEFTINIVFKYICGSKRKVSLKRNLENIKCFYLTLNSFGNNNFIKADGDLVVDKEKMIIDVKFIEKKRALVI